MGSYREQRVCVRSQRSHSVVLSQLSVQLHLFPALCDVEHLLF